MAKKRLKNGSGAGCTERNRVYVQNCGARKEIVVETLVMKKPGFCAKLWSKERDRGRNPVSGIVKAAPTDLKIGCCSPE
jgi:hypothetical protein